jgi:hypothetical protein
MKDRVEVTKNFRDEEGAVILGPRNFTTNPEKKNLIGIGQVDKIKPHGGNFPAMAAYDIAKEIA